MLVFGGRLTIFLYHLRIAQFEKDHEATQQKMTENRSSSQFPIGSMSFWYIYLLIYRKNEPFMDR